MATRATGTTAWPVNADESDLPDYEAEGKSEATIRFCRPTPYRSSDHVPVLAEIDAGP
ncbi:MAG: hypothetical protein ACLFRG_01560 [Desulfococcaceae bacterium]